MKIICKRKNHHLKEVKTVCIKLYEIKIIDSILFIKRHRRKNNVTCKGVLVKKTPKQQIY